MGCRKCGVRFSTAVTHTHPKIRARHDDVRLGTYNLHMDSHMATAKKSPIAKTAAPAKTAPKKVAVKAALAKKPAAAAPAALKPIKTTFNKTTLLAHLVETTGQEPKAVKAVLGALEATLLASINKKGAGEFSWPGVVKVTALQVPAKKARKGIDPFTKQERTFAAKPASVKVKARFFKKVKDAAL